MPESKRVAQQGVSAIRGAALSYTKDPFQNPVEDCFVYEADALIVMRDGLITAFGPASEIAATLGDEVPVSRYENSLIMPGFIDCHVHYPQTEIIGVYGKHLLDWLHKYTFVAEQKFKNRDHAHATAKVFLRESIRCGTTTSSVFCTVDPTSVDAFFAEAEKLNMRNIAGKVLMDRNAPAELLDTPQQGYDQTQALIKRWHGKGRALYGVTPRFAPTSSPQQMEMTGSVWRENPGTYLQSHVSENTSEIEWVRTLFPDCRNYVDVYARFGQLGERSILDLTNPLLPARYPLERKNLWFRN
jgi:guanine deaminase